MGHENCGRYEKTSSEFIENEGKELEKWIQQDNNLFMMRFALERGYHPQRFTEWCEINKIFAEFYARAKQYQELKLNEKGLLGIHKEQMSKFCLINHHNYKDKTEIAASIDGKLSISTVDYSKAD